MSNDRVSDCAEYDPKEVCKWDPFAGVVESALLNSTDIDAYARSLLPPLFSDYDVNGLKPATYEIKFEGDIYWWEDGKSYLDQINLNYENSAFEAKLKHKKLGCDDDFEIPPNSIVFIVPKTYFRVPPYLALRFNLHIRLVHRGLLLGTGPLVDPGFAGNLMIPVHNLTSDPAVIRGDQGFIWIEITKLSRVRFGGVPVEFDSKKNARTVRQYLHSANRMNPIVSTLRVTLRKLEDLAMKMRTYSAYASVIFVFSLLSVLYGGWSLLRDAQQYVGDAEKNVEDAIARLGVEKRSLEILLLDIAKERALLQKESNELRLKNSELERRLTPAHTIESKP